VCVKVDREERPDVDEIYMAATQLITRSGGWPNSVFLTPERKPFFAGTYFPPHDGLGRPGFPRVLQSLREAWLLRRPEVLQQAEAIAAAMQSHLANPGMGAASPPGPEVADDLQAALAARFDPDWGGFSPAPKFPSPSNLFFLLDRRDDEEAREMLVVTLDRMARGGIHDHLAGGFHRYSTDEAWLVPHFEKMLYDNAALARLYAEAAPLAPGAGFEAVCRSTLDFVLDRMTSPQGGFLSAIDAETDGHEGAYYTWTGAELDEFLPAADREVFRAVYGLQGPPTFEEDRYVLHLPAPADEQARALGVPPAELGERLERGRRALLAAREAREAPLIDDKVLADWNGLMIGALARAGELLGEDRYAAAAVRAADFVLSRLRGDDGGLLHAYRSGEARVPAFLDDYAFLVEGLLRLHDATSEARWLEEALRLTLEQEGRLADPGGGYFTAGEDPSLLVRSRTVFDGAVASGNGTAILNLLDLARRTGESELRSRAAAALGAFAPDITATPLAHVTLVRAAVRWADAPPATAAHATTPAASAAAAAPARSAVEDLQDEAREVVDIEGRLGRGDDDVWKPFTLELAIGPRFHINADQVEEPALVATSVAGVMGRVRHVRYPSPQPLAGGAVGWRGRVRIEGEVEHRGGGAAAVEVQYQACDDARCLPPVSRLVRLG